MTNQPRPHTASRLTADRSSYVEAITFFWEKNFGLQAPWARFQTQFAAELTRTFDDEQVAAITPAQWSCLRLMLTGTRGGASVQCGAATKMCERLGSYDDGNFIERTFQLICKPYFFGDMSKEDTESLLKRIHNDGAFCVRFTSSTPLSLAVSVYCNGSVRHYRAMYTQGKGFHTGHTSYPSLTGLLQRKAELLKLEFPCPYSPYAKIVEDMGEAELGLSRTSLEEVEGDDYKTPPGDNIPVHAINRPAGTSISAVSPSIPLRSTKPKVAPKPTGAKRSGDDPLASLKQQAKDLPSGSTDAGGAWGVQPHRSKPDIPAGTVLNEVSDLVAYVLGAEEEEKADVKTVETGAVDDSPLPTSPDATAPDTKTHSVIVQIFGGAKREVLLDPHVFHLSVGELAQAMATELGLPYPAEMALALPSDHKRVAKKDKLDGGDKLHWLSSVQTLGQQDVAFADTFILRRRYHQEGRMYVQGAARDEYDVEFFYEEMKSAIVSGAWRPSIQEALNLAAAQCQVDMGDYRDAHMASLDGSNVICPEYHDLLAKSVNGVVDRWIVLRGMSRAAAMMRYIQLTTELPFFGVTFFPVRHLSKGPRGKRKALGGSFLGVGHSGIHLKTPSMPSEGHLTHPFPHLYRWAPSPKGLVLDFGCHSSSFLQVLTPDSDEIVLLIEEHLARGGYVYEGTPGAESSAPAAIAATPATPPPESDRVYADAPGNLVPEVLAGAPTEEADPQVWNSRDQFASREALPDVKRKDSAIKSKFKFGLKGKKKKGRDKKNSTLRGNDGPASPMVSPISEGRSNPFSKKKSKGSAGKADGKAATMGPLMRRDVTEPSKERPPPAKHSSEEKIDRPFTRADLSKKSLAALVQLCKDDSAKEAKEKIVDILLRAQATKLSGTSENRPPLRMVRGKHNFAGEADHELDFSAGQLIAVFDTDESGWYLAEIDGKRGYIPNTYVEDVSSDVVAAFVSELKSQGFSTIQDITQRDDFVALSALCYCIESSGDARDKVVTLALDFLMSRNAEYQFMEKLIQAEVQGTAHETTLFRTNTVTAVVLRVHSFIVGSSFLRAMLRPSVEDLREFIDAGNSIEMDANLLEPGQSVFENALNLACITNNFMGRITEFADRFPAPIKRIGQFLRCQVEKKFGDFGEKAMDNALAGYVFLRFICPAIITPAKYGITDTSVSPKARRALLLVTKVLQSWANGMRFKGHDSMVPLNFFLSTLTDKSFIFAMIMKGHANAPDETHGSSESRLIGQDKLLELYKFYSTYLPQMTQSLSDNEKYVTTPEVDLESAREVLNSLGGAVKSIKEAERLEPLTRV